MGDIIWYNDVLYCQQLSSPGCGNALNTSSKSSSPTTATTTNPDGDILNELTSILLACESFDILTTSDDAAEPRLSFSTYAGHTIEFRVNSSLPSLNLLFNPLTVNFF